MSGTVSCGGTGFTSPVSVRCCTIDHEPSCGRIREPRAALTNTLLPAAFRAGLTSTRDSRMRCFDLAMSIVQSTGPPSDPFWNRSRSAKMREGIRIDDGASWT